MKKEDFNKLIEGLENAVDLANPKKVAKKKVAKKTVKTKGKRHASK